MSIDPNRYRATADSTVEDIDLDEETVIIGGRRYTEADAQRDAAAAEARTRGLSQGGYSLSGDGSHSPSITTTVPRTLRNEVRDRAKAEGMSVSKWVRRLIEREVNHPAA